MSLRWAALAPGRSCPGESCMCFGVLPGDGGLEVGIETSVEAVMQAEVSISSQVIGGAAASLARSPLHVQCPACSVCGVMSF